MKLKVAWRVEVWAIDGEFGVGFVYEADARKFADKWRRLGAVVNVIPA